MGKTREVLVKVEYHGQVWYEVKLINKQQMGTTHVTNSGREYEGRNPSKVVSRSTDETNSL